MLLSAGLLLELLGRRKRRARLNLRLLMFNKNIKKYLLSKKRILFAKHTQPHPCDNGDVLSKVNKALTHGRPDGTVRLVEMVFTQKPNLAYGQGRKMAQYARMVLC